VDELPAEFCARWTPRAIKKACEETHGRYKRGLEKAYTEYFIANPDLATEHPYKARDLPCALPPGWASLGGLIKPAQRHRHHLSGGSSQILALALLGSAAASDPSLAWLPSLLGIDAFGSAAPRAVFEHGLDSATLNEKPRVTSIDLLVDDEAVLVCAEAKLWEQGLGSCTCGDNGGEQADTEEPEVDPSPAQERGACSPRVLSRSLYYKAAQEILGLPARTTDAVCPIAAPYQAVRNIAAARALAMGRKPVFVLFFDARNPYFARCDEWPGWPAALMTLAEHQDKVAVRACSWQQLLGSGAVPADVCNWASEKHGLFPSRTVITTRSTD
jgi:hypothetical protein